MRPDQITEVGLLTSRLLIDLGAIDRNVRRFRDLLNAPSPDRAPGADAAPESPSPQPGSATGGSARRQVAVCAVVKQDAYGLGLARIAKRLATSGAEMLAVYNLDEARAILDAGVTTPVLVLMPVWQLDRADPLYRLIVGGRLHLTLHSQAQAQDLAAHAARLGVDLPVHVQVDTGLSRGGCLPDEAEALVRYVTGTPRLRLAGVMTHFSSPGGAGADLAFSREQARLFKQWLERTRPLFHAGLRPGQRPLPVQVHAANTVAALRHRAWHATMARIGQGLYGYGAEVLPRGEDDLAGGMLEPAIRWVSKIVHVQSVPAGWPVGYDRTFTTARPSRIALVPVGYANGYPRDLSNQAQVRLTGLRYDRPRVGTSLDEPVPAPGATAWARVVGRVSMDQITLDVTDLPESLSTVGCEVELVSADASAPNHLPRLAALAGSITHELTCRIAPSVERVYCSSAAAAPVPGTTGPGSTGPGEHAPRPSVLTRPTPSPVIGSRPVVVAGLPARRAAVG